MPNTSEATISPAGFRKLHAATLWIPATEFVSGMIVPVLIASFFFSPVVVLSFCGLFVVLPTCLGWIIHYLCFTYSLGPRALAIRSGLLGRTLRNIPYERVQDVRIRQPPIHRLLGYAKVEIETAANESVELSLDVVTLAESERIRQAVTGPEQDQDGEPAHTPPPDLESLHLSSVRELILGGMTTHAVAFLGAAAGAAFYFIIAAKLEGLTQEQWNMTPHLPWSWNDWSPKLLGHMPWLETVLKLLTEDTLGKAIALAAAGLVFAVVQFVIAYHGFTLVRSGTIIKRTFGLLTRHEFAVPLSRIQVLRIETNLLRRWFGLVEIRMDTASHRAVGDEEKKRPRAGVLLPVVTVEKAVQVVQQVMPDLRWTGVTWQSVAPKAVARKTRRDCLILGLVVMPNLLPFGAYALLPLCLLPVIYFWNKAWYRHLGYTVHGDYFLERKGWYKESITIVPLRNIQSVVFTQNPLERRAGLATLTVEVGGSDHTGGAPPLPYLTLKTASQLHRELTVGAAGRPFTW
jgi:putative membrane protein